MRIICYCKQVMIKNKNFLEQSVEQLSTVARNGALTMMGIAAVAGMIELGNHQENKVTLINQPVMAFAGNNASSDNPLRREKESTETSSVQISYNTVQRTPARSTRIK